MNLFKAIKILESINEEFQDNKYLLSFKLHEEFEELIQELTPRSMDQKPEHEQWCLVFDNDGESFIARYNAGLNSFHDDYWIRSSESYKWIPAPQWKVDE